MDDRGWPYSGGARSGPGSGCYKSSFSSYFIIPWPLPLMNAWSEAIFLHLQGCIRTSIFGTKKPWPFEWSPFFKKRKKNDPNFPRIEDIFGVNDARLVHACTYVLTYPDGFFSNLKPRKPIDRWILCNTETTIGWFWGSDFLTMVRRGMPTIVHHESASVALKKMWTFPTGQEVAEVFFKIQVCHERIYFCAFYFCGAYAR